VKALIFCLAALALTVYFEPARITISGNEVIPITRVEAAPPQVGRSGGAGGPAPIYGVTTYVPTAATSQVITLTGNTSGTLISTSNSATPMLTR
jgi:hypothetical protein